jgi:hypothetical protein
MRTHFEFRSRLASSGEILTQQTLFLPVEPVRPPASGEIYTREMQHFKGFLPVFSFTRKNLTMAQPLLKEV